MAIGSRDAVVSEPMEMAQMVLDRGATDGGHG